MIFFFQIAFWILLLLIIHSYVFYPLVLFFLSKNKKENNTKYSFDSDLPTVSILMAVHNEQEVIEQKIRSIFETNYPLAKIEFLIGSDNSTDQTNIIINNLSLTFPEIKFFEFNERMGKVKIINYLSEKASNQIFILTDAKAFFEKETIFHLIEHFKHSEITFVGGILVNPNKNVQGISSQENLFINREIKIKYREGLIWQKSIGVYGALCSIRAKDFIKVPENLLVDDFYETMKILDKGGKVVFNLQALATETLPLFISEEFKRKVRISTGNFQNLRIFAKIVLKPFSSLGFAFISHKVIRWISPFIFMFIVIFALLLLDILFYKLFLCFVIAIFIVPIIDFLLQKIKINIYIFRLITHFIAMNFAIIIGFLESIGGVKNSYWKPSNRKN